jgi:hypothetical protein
MKHGNQLELERCPHCNVAKPHLIRQWQTDSMDHANRNKRHWSIFKCISCGGMILGGSPHDSNHPIDQIWPTPQVVASEVPARARAFLSQAIASLNAPAGAVMLTASAVDAMLKEKGLKDGSLYARIEAAAKDHLISAEMAAWAHEIRLDANDQQHANEEADLPDEANAAKVIEFAITLAQFLFVLPARVEHGRKS